MLKRRGFITCSICSAVGLVATEVDANAQGTPPGFTRTLVQKTEYPGDKYIAVLMTIDIEPDALVPRHTHPGVESSFLVSGSGTLSIQGQPDRLVRAGEGFQIPPETPHSVRNGPERTRVAATFIVEKDKPLASPAPE